MPTPQRRRALLGGGVLDIRTIAPWVFGFDARFIAGVADGAACGSWPDFMAAHNTVQVTGPNQPLYRATGLNGRPCLDFDGTNDLLTASSFAWGSNIAEVFYVATRDTNAAAHAISEFGAVGTAGSWSCRVETNDDASAILTGDVGNANYLNPGFGANARVGWATFDMSLATNEASLRLDGVLTGSRSSNNNNTGNFATAALGIGARAAGVTYHDGKIAFLAAMNTSCDAALGAKIVAALKTIWGIA